jgi:3-hydroxyisobutyrate dehydrogenase-like beta-hydroxyacid dehydrogenase
MGQAVAAQIKSKGLRVVAALDGRSERSRALARAAGLEDVGTLERMVAECDVILSIMNPAAAEDFAGTAAMAIAQSARKPLFVDCNAVSPATVQAMAREIAAAGGTLVDGGIIGPPPRGTAKPRLYVSGQDAARLTALETPQLIVRVVGERVGEASALKMCYGAMTKGATALALELLIAARHLGVEEALERELLDTRREVYEWIIGALPVMPPKAYRWVPEMEQEAATFAEIGMTPRILQGAADMYAFVADTPLGRETPENRDRSRTGRDVVRELADALKRA